MSSRDLTNRIAQAAAADAPAPPRKPPWLRVRLPRGEKYVRLRGIIEANRLHTVCQSASCPNLGECWSAGTATVMILGGVCTRDCRFCDVPPGRPDAADEDEPARVADAVRRMGLRHVVITSVNRDDLPDAGSAIWAATVRQVRAACPGTTIEVLPGDFGGQPELVRALLDARPDIFGHNVETVPRLYPLARPQADYARSLNVLRQAAGAGLTTKSGLMVGLGETNEEVVAVLRDLRATGVSIVTIGQYLRPSREHLPVARYVPPEEFDAWQRLATELGFTGAACAPLVRSSYHAEQFAAGKREDEGE